MAESSAASPPERVEKGGEEGEGLSATFHEKVIQLRTMQLRLLLPSAVAITIVIAGALLFALRDLPWPALGAGRNIQTGQLQTVPLPVAVFGGLALTVAWSFILTGALHAHLLFRIGGVLAYLMNGLTVFLPAIATASTLLTLPFLLASVVVASIALYAADRSNHRQAPHLHHRFRLRLPTFAWVLGATALLYVLGILGGLRQGDVAFFLTAQLTLLEIVLIPVLFLAGTDFAEWSEVVSGRAGSLFMRLPGWTLRAAIVVAAVAVLLWAALLEGGPHRPDVGAIALQSAPVLILLVPVGLVGWFAQRRPTSTRVPFWALVLGVAAVFVPLFGASAVEAREGSLPSLPAGIPALVVYQHADPTYSVSVPEGWARSSVPGGTEWTGAAPRGGVSRLVVVSAGAVQSAGSDSVRRGGALALGRPLQLGSRSRARGWDRWDVTTSVAPNPQHGVAFLRQDGGRAWILIGLSPAGTDQEALWNAVRETWSPGPPAPVGLPLPSLGLALPWIGLGLVLMFGIGLMLFLMGRGEVATAGVFLLVCALFEAAGQNLAGNLMQFLGIHDPPYVQPQFLAVGVSVAALVLFSVTGAVPRWRPAAAPLRLVLVLLLGVIGLDLLYTGVFQTALEGGQRFSVLQGVVLVAAMLWDVLMSGESFTNQGGPRVPRHSRVLIYLGYTIAVVTAVVVLGSLGFEGGGVVGGFESDKWVQEGIVGFGAPLLFTFFFVNLSAWRHALPEEAGEIDQVDRSILVETGA